MNKALLERWFLFDALLHLLTSACLLALVFAVTKYGKQILQIVKANFGVSFETHAKVWDDKEVLEEIARRNMKAKMDEVNGVTTE